MKIWSGSYHERVGVTGTVTCGPDMLRDPAVPRDIPQLLFICHQGWRRTARRPLPLLCGWLYQQIPFPRCCCSLLECMTSLVWGQENGEQLTECISTIPRANTVSSQVLPGQSWGGSSLTAMLDHPSGESVPPGKQEKQEAPRQPSRVRPNKSCPW